MIVLGLILVLVAVVAGGVLAYENTDLVTLRAFGGEWQVNTYWIAVVGAAILLVAVLGVVMIRAGSRRGLRRRQERKQLERENAALADRVRHADDRPATDHREHDSRDHTALDHDGRTTVPSAAPVTGSSHAASAPPPYRG